MKTLITFLLLANAILSTAQITYMETDGPRAGLTIASRRFVDLPILDLDPLKETGGNKSWDVRGVYEDIEDSQYIGVQNLYFKGKFPGANIAKIVEHNPDSSYTMMEKNSFGLFIIGSWNPFVEIVYVPKLMIIPFPLSFGMNFQNDVTADYVVGGVNYKIDYLKTNATVDAWGMMTTNDGTFPAIKVKTIEITEISADGTPFASATIESHSWLKSGLADPLVTIRSSETEVDTFLLTDTTLTNSHQQIFVSNEEIHNAEMKLSISPNPVLNQVSIECKNVSFNTTTYSIINAEGKTILNGILNDNAKLELDLNHLPSGNYLVQMILDQKTTLFDIISKR